MNIRFPVFRSSDPELDKTYDYRCEVYQKHVKETPDGHVVTEFLPDVPWAGIYNTINCAAMHHFRDGRWLADTSLMEEYAQFWCTAGNPRLYSFPIADSFRELALVTGNYSTDSFFAKLEEICRGWDDHRCADGMYRQQCGYDGMEYSISGDGVRPTINSYMTADMRALSGIAKRAGDEEKAEFYKAEADKLAQQINDRLWNEEIGMFCVESDSGEKQNVREQIGFIPWIYGIPVSGRDGCFRYLLDKDCFLSPYGLRTADASHPDYMKEFKHECLWNGPIWPFASSQTLTAVIEYLHTSENPVISNEDFMSLLLTFAYSHRDTDGSPYLDENMDPNTGVWLAREILRSWGGFDRGMHYNHSSFINLVITGICGIIPSDGDILTIHPLGTSLDRFELSGVKYHGHNLDVSWDKNDGLRVIVDGNEKGFVPASEEAVLTIEL